MHFFYQAEDGIRYRDVTGVQTCALPISRLWTMPIPQSLVFIFDLLESGFRTSRPPPPEARRPRGNIGVEGGVVTRARRQTSDARGRSGWWQGAPPVCGQAFGGLRIIAPEGSRMGLVRSAFLAGSQ